MAGNENYTDFQRQSPVGLTGVVDHVTKIDQRWALNHIGLIFHSIMQILGTTPSGTTETVSQRFLDVEDAMAIVKASVAPSNPVIKKIWHDTSANEIKQWDGDSWKTVAMVLPDGGTVGQIVTRTADGSEWSDP